MSRDLRVGLSLSLLVLGAAGAFCFRVDPAPVDDVTAAEDTAEDPTDALPPPGPPPEPVRLAAVPAPPVPAGVKPAPPAPVPRVGPPPVARPVPPAAVAEAPPAAVVAVEPTPAAGPRVYKVRPGDTLTGIAERELGSHRRFDAIFEANRDVLLSPDALQVGMTLTIPGEARL